MPTVLCADADRELRDVYVWLLSSYGFQVEPGGSSATGQYQEIRHVTYTDQNHFIMWSEKLMQLCEKKII